MANEYKNPRTCILYGEPGEDPEDCATHGHEVDDAPNVKTGPDRDDGLPAWVEWNGERFETPGFEEVARLCHDSVSESLDGEDIEPDGVTFNGCPSWPLALGII